LAEGFEFQGARQSAQGKKTGRKGCLDRGFKIELIHVVLQVEVEERLTIYLLPINSPQPNFWLQKCRHSLDFG
jgi:hypothetical protein